MGWDGMEWNGMGWNKYSTQHDQAKVLSDYTVITHCLSAAVIIIYL
jgi:hypothetical protein